MTDQITRLGISVDTKGARPAVRGLRTDLDRLTTSGEKASAQSAILTRTLAVAGTTLAAYAGSQSVGKLVADASRLESINSRISNLTGDLASSQRFLTESAAELSAEYTTLASGYAQLLTLYDGGLLTLQQTQSLTLGITEAAAATGASNAEVGRSIVGLSQTLGDSVVNMENYRQIYESIPGLNKRVADSMGLTTGELKDLISTGTLASGQFAGPLLDAFESYAGTAVSMSGNITQAFNRTTNEYTKLVATFSQPINTAATGVADELADSLAFINENSDEVIIGFQAVGAAAALAFGGASLNAVASFGKAQADSIKTAIDRQDEFAKKLATRADRQAVYRAKSAKSAADEALAEATLTREVAKANAVRATSAVQDQAKLVSSAQLAVLKKQEILSESQLSVAVAKTTQAEALRAAVRAEQGAISATTNAVRLRYAQSLEVASAAEAKASTAVSLANNQEALAKTNLNKASAISDAQSRRLAQAKINEGKASSAVVASATAEGAAYGVANKAKIASVLASQNLAKANLRATAAIRGATVAQRLQTTAMIAGTAATKAATGAYALMGGPAGVALASGALVYYALKQSEVTKATNDVLRATRDLNNEFSRVGVEAITESAARRSDLQDQINKLIEQKAKIINGTADQPLFGTVDQEAALSNLQKRIDFMNKSLKGLEIGESLILSAKATSDEFEDMFGIASDGLRQVQDATKISSQEIRDNLAKLFPDDKKLASLEVLRGQLESIKGEIPIEEYNRSSEALQSQINTLNGFEERANKAKRAAEELQEIVSEALPQRTALDEQAEKLAILDAAYARGGDNAQLYADAIDSLSKQFRDEALETAAEKVRDITDALENRAETPFSNYADEINLLNRALDEVPDRAGDLAGKLQTAFANLDFEIRAELTVASGDTTAELQSSFDEQSAALDEFHAARNVSEAQAQADRLKLAASYGDQLVDANRSAIEKLSSLGGLTEGLRLEFEISGDQINLAQLLRDGEITREQFQEAERLQAETHQERLSEIVRSGLGTRSQIENASFGDRLASTLNQYSTEIQIASDFASTALSSVIEGEQNKTAALQDRVSTDQESYDDALAAFKENGSEENSIALANAKTRLKISTAAAKQQFEQQKDYNRAQVVMNTAAGITTAFRNSVVPFGWVAESAAIAASGLAQLVTINRSSLSSSSSSISANSGGSNASIETNTASPDDSTSAGQNIQVFNLNGVLALDQDQVIAQSVKRLADDGYILDSSLNTLNTQNITIQ